MPRPLCFCFFLIVLTVTFFPFFQSMVHLETAGEKQHFNTRHKEGTEWKSSNIKAKMASHSLDKAAWQDMKWIIVLEMCMLDRSNISLSENTIQVCLGRVITDPIPPIIQYLWPNNWTSVAKDRIKLFQKKISPVWPLENNTLYPLTTGQGSVHLP